MQTSPLTKRIIPCLDVKNGRVVKGVNFVGLQDAGDPIEVARCYNDQGADEITFLDIAASVEGRGTTLNMVKNVAKEIFIPLTVGGGIRTLKDIYSLLNVGCDKVSLNSSAIKNPSLITEGAKRFGSQCVVIAIDAKKVAENRWEVFINGGSKATGIELLGWVREVEDRGAGEILLTSMDADGTKKGYDLEQLEAVCQVSNIPIIASGGAGSKEHILGAFRSGASAALAASIFHYKEIAIQELKEFLDKHNVKVRL